MNNIGKHLRKNSETTPVQPDDNQEKQEYFAPSANISKEARSLLNRLNDTKNNNNNHYETVVNDAKYSEQTLLEVYNYLKNNNSTPSQIISVLEVRLKKPTNQTAKNMNQPLLEEVITSLEKTKNVKFDLSFLRALPDLGYEPIQGGKGSHIHKFIRKTDTVKSQYLNFQPDRKGNFKQSQLHQLKQQLAEISQPKEVKSEIKKDNIPPAVRTSSATKPNKPAKSVAQQHIAKQETAVDNVQPAVKPSLAIKLNEPAKSVAPQHTADLATPVEPAVHSDPNLAYNQASDISQHVEASITKQQNNTLLSPNPPKLKTANNSIPERLIRRDDIANKIYQIILNTPNLSQKTLSELAFDEQLKKSAKNCPYNYIVLADLYCAGKYCNQNEDNIQKAIVTLQLANKQGVPESAHRLYDLYQVLKNTKYKTIIYGCMKEMALSSSNENFTPKLLLCAINYQDGQQKAAINMISLITKTFIQDEDSNVNLLITTLSSFCRQILKNQFLEMTVLKFHQKVTDENALDELRFFQNNVFRLRELQFTIGVDELAKGNHESGVELLINSTILGYTNAEAKLGTILPTINYKKIPTSCEETIINAIKNYPEKDNSVLIIFLYNIALAYLKNNESDKAIDLFIETAQQSDQQSISYLMNFYCSNNKYTKKINEKFLNNKVNEDLTINYLTKKTQDGDYEASIQLAFIYSPIGLNKTEKAISALAKAMNLVGQNVMKEPEIDLIWYYTRIGRCYQICEIFNQACEAYEFVIRLTDKNQFNYSDFNIVVENYNKCLTNRQLTNKEIYESVVTELKDSNNSLELAIVKLKYLLTIDYADTDKKHDYYYSALASCYRNQNKLSEALSCAKTAVSIRVLRYAKSQTQDDLKLLNRAVEKHDRIQKLKDSSLAVHTSQSQTQ